MTASKVIDILEQITYKPNFKFYITRHHIMDEILIRLCAYVPNVNDPKDLIPITISSIIVLSRHLSEESLICQFIRMIEKFEMHEMNEWLKYKGKCLKEPHSLDKQG